VLGDYVYARNGYLAGTDAQRASDLMRMYQDPSVKAILPTRGGVGVQGILPYLNYGFIAEHPKIISGYSDITILLNKQHLDCVRANSYAIVDPLKTA